MCHGYIDFATGPARRRPTVQLSIRSALIGTTGCTPAAPAIHDTLVISAADSAQSGVQCNHMTYGGQPVLRQLPKSRAHVPSNFLARPGLAPTYATILTTSYHLTVENSICNLSCCGFAGAGGLND